VIWNIHFGDLKNESHFSTVDDIVETITIHLIFLISSNNELNFFKSHNLIILLKSFKKRFVEEMEHILIVIQKYS
jgi:hypothetical protein